ncbi:MAG: potassium channel family protein [Bacteroidota bacterium]
MKKFLTLLDEYKYLIALLSTLNFLLTPIHIEVSGFNATHVVVINYSLVILASSLIASNNKNRARTYILGLIALSFIWIEYMERVSVSIEVLRLISSLVLFSNFCVLLVQQLRNIKTMNLKFILGPLLGFIYLGIIGGILFEFTHLMDPASFQFTKNFSGYSFYYFSFISITTVGYGDITPLTAPAQSLTLVMNIIGQFYLAIVIAVFVGKYINEK